MFKIRGISNFALETVSDQLVAENIASKEHADAMCQAMREKFSGDQATYWYEVVPQEKELYKFEP